MATNERIIFLLDMDAFFASIEQRENPDLKGKPVIVVGSTKTRSVVCAASYEARRFGVHSAMPFTQAQRLCPHAEVISAHSDLYRQASRNVFSICENFTDLVEISSIDECYMDMTPTAQRFGGPVSAARMIKQRIQDEEGLNCTIGIGPNKLIAKLATDTHKPDGLHQITASNVPHLFADLPLSKLHGIGGKTAAKLASMGITTAASLGSVDRAVLVRVFGVYGDTLSNMGQGRDDSPIVPYYEQLLPKSISHEHTMATDTRDLEFLKRTLHNLAERVAYRLRKKGLSAKTVGIIVRFGNLQRITRSHTLSEHTDDGLAIYHAASALLEAAMSDPRPVRLIGISTGNLNQGIIQQGLFDDPRRRHLTSVVDALNERFGSMAVRPASLVHMSGSDHITFKE